MKLKSFIVISSLIVLFSCKTMESQGSSSRKSISYNIINSGYSSAQMSINQVNSTIHNVALLAIEGAIFTNSDTEGVSVLSDKKISSSDYNYLVDDRQISISRNVYQIKESGVIRFKAPAVSGKKVNAIVNSSVNSNTLSKLIVTAIENNTKPGEIGRIYLSGNISLNDEKGSGSAIFTITE